MVAIARTDVHVSSTQSLAGKTLTTRAAGFSTTATAAGTTTLTVASNAIQEFTGTSTQTVALPTTSVAAGHQYEILNNSTGLVTVQSSGGNAVVILAAGTEATITALFATPTTAAHWEAVYAGDLVASGKSLTVNNTLTLTGTDGTTHTLPSTSSTVARTDAAQTFTGVQTMTSPVITTPRINQINDTNGATALVLSATASAVNHAQIVNAAIGGGVLIQATGSDTNVQLSLRPRGNSGPIVLQAGNSNNMAVFYGPGVAGVVANSFVFQTALTGVTPSIQVSSSDTNASLNLMSKGTGTVQANGVAVSTNSITATHTAQQIELGHATDTTISRVSAGVIAVEGNTVATRLTGTATLDFGSVTAASFADLTITVTGAATGDAVALGTPTAAITAGIAFTAWVSATDTVTVRAHNYTAGALDPASGTFRATIIR